MIFSETAYTGTIEFLAADEFVAIPAHITESTAVKAGSLIDEDGKIAEANASSGLYEDIAGILLYDVDPAVNPNCALLVQGVVDLTKMNTHASTEYTAGDITAVLPGIVCRTNIGVNT